MSRIGKTPVTIPQNVEITLSATMIVVKGKLGTRQIATNPLVDVNKTDEGIQVTPKSMAKKNRMMWGTMQRNISNAVIGVTEGFTKKLEIEGVGYRAQMKGTDVQLALGFSHDVIYKVPSDIKIVIEGDRNNVINVSGIDSQRVGQIASEIRGYRPPEPYKGKGVRYQGEFILRKEGKKK